MPTAREQAEEAESNLDEFDRALCRIHPELVTPRIFEEFKTAVLELNRSNRFLLRWLADTSDRLDELEAQVNG